MGRAEFFAFAATSEGEPHPVDPSLTSDQVSDQGKALLKAYGSDAELTSDELLRRLGLRHKPTFRKNHLNPALLAGMIEMTEPDSLRSPTQRYRLTDAGRRISR